MCNRASVNNKELKFFLNNSFLLPQQVTAVNVLLQRTCLITPLVWTVDSVGTESVYRSVRLSSTCNRAPAMVCIFFKSLSIEFTQCSRVQFSRVQRSDTASKNASKCKYLSANTGVQCRIWCKYFHQFQNLIVFFQLLLECQRVFELADSTSFCKTWWSMLD